MIHTFISLSLTTKMAIPCRVCVCITVWERGRHGWMLRWRKFWNRRMLWQSYKK